MRRMTTGLVLTLSATCSDLRGFSPDQAIKLSTCTATANLLFVGISKLWGFPEPPFCNHYSYKFDFVNSIVLHDLPPQKAHKHKKTLNEGFLCYVSFVPFCGSNCGRFEFLDESEEGVDIDGFRDEREITDRERAL